MTILFSNSQRKGIRRDLRCGRVLIRLMWHWTCQECFIIISIEWKIFFMLLPTKRILIFPLILFSAILAASWTVWIWAALSVIFLYFSNNCMVIFDTFSNASFGIWLKILISEKMKNLFPTRVLDRIYLFWNEHFF